jgi:hypothetical protein
VSEVKTEIACSVFLGVAGHGASAWLTCALSAPGASVSRGVGEETLVFLATASGRARAVFQDLSGLPSRRNEYLEQLRSRSFLARMHSQSPDGYLKQFLDVRVLAS